MHSDSSYKPLGKSYKKKYPFRLGTTSFIYPDDYAENVRRLAPFLDEIEILLFESLYDGGLPDKKEISALYRLKELHQIAYNIHLPTDISIADTQKRKQVNAIDIIKNIFDRVDLLSPETFTLHIPWDDKKLFSENKNEWLDAAFTGINALLEYGISPRKISIENLMYPYEWFYPVVKEFDLAVTMDIGHLIVQGLDIEDMNHMFSDRISMIHFHGVDRSGNKASDHVSLTCLEDSEIRKVMEILTSYQNGVSIEVFSFDNLQSSLDCFCQFFPGKTLA